DGAAPRLDEVVRRADLRVDAREGVAQERVRARGLLRALTERGERRVERRLGLREAAQRRERVTALARGARLRDGVLRLGERGRDPGVAGRESAGVRDVRRDGREPPVEARA